MLLQKMNLMAASILHRQLWLASGSRSPPTLHNPATRPSLHPALTLHLPVPPSLSVFVFPLTSRGTLHPVPPRVLQLPNPLSDVNALRFGYYGSMPLLCCVDMLGMLTILFVADHTLTPHTLACHLPSSQDNSCWSISFSPPHHPSPYILTSSNTHRLFHIHLPPSLSHPSPSTHPYPTSLDGATVTPLDVLHGHNIPSTDVDEGGVRVVSGCIDGRVRVIEGGMGRPGEGEGVRRVLGGRYGRGWVWAVRFFPRRWVRRETRTREEVEEARWARRRERQRAPPSAGAGGGGAQGGGGAGGLALVDFVHLVRGLVDHVADGWLPGEGLRGNEVGRREHWEEEDRQRRAG